MAIERHIGTNKLVSSESEINIERKGYLPDRLYSFIANLVDGEVNITAPEDNRIRISRGARIHIRRLKQEGRADEAEQIYKQQRQKKIRLNEQNLHSQEAETLLQETVMQLLNTEVSSSGGHVQELLLGIKTTWLANAAGYIDEEKRKSIVGEIYDLNPAQEEQVTQEWLKIRDDMSRLMPKK